MAAPAPIDVGSTLVALARTLGSDAWQQQLGLATLPAPRLEAADPGTDRDVGRGPDSTHGGADAGAIELSKDARYEPIETLGAGGMGEVVAVWDRDLMRPLALKQPHADQAEDGLGLRHFLWEARITAHLIHELRRRKGRYGVGSACIGGGQGIALVLEAV